MLSLAQMLMQTIHNFLNFFEGVEGLKENCGVTDACRGEWSISKGLKGLLLKVQGQGTIKRFLSVGARDRDWGNLVEDGQKIDQGGRTKWMWF